MIPFIEQYEKLIADLSSTINGRLANVISSQARNSVGTVVTATSINASPNELVVLGNTLPTNLTRRSSLFSEVVKREYVNPPTLVVWVTARAIWSGDKAVVVVSSEVEFFKDSKNGTTIFVDPYLASYTSKSNNVTGLKKFMSTVMAGAINTRITSYLAAANALQVIDGDPPIEKALVAIEDNMLITPDVDALIETGLSDLQGNVDGIVKEEIDKIKKSVEEEVEKVLEEIEDVKEGVEDVKRDIEDTTRDVEDNVNTAVEASTNTETNTTPETVETIQTNRTKESNRKFLSIEAIEDDEVDQLLVRPDGTGFVNTARIDDDTDLLTREDSAPLLDKPEKSTEQKDLENVVGEEDDDSGDGYMPYIPPTVAHKEYQQKVVETEAQRRGEFSDALSKAATKEKSATAPAGANLLVQEAGGIDNVADLLEDREKPEEKPKQTPNAKYFLEWAAGEGADPNGIIYRGTRPRDYKKPPAIRPNIKYGSVERRYKSLFDFGKDLNGIFSGYQADSPVDIALLMNSGAIGRFNKNWPYMFGEGSEIHAAILRSNPAWIDDKQQGGFGIFGAGRKYADANWAANPHWCGIFTNFALHTNGLYQSDSKLVNITGTATVQSLYKSSPFNTVPEGLTKSKREKIQAQLDELMADTTGANQNEIDKLKKKLNGEPSFDENGKCALFLQGEHWTADGLTSAGVDLWDRIKQWPGGFCVRRHPHKNGGHVEVLLHMTKTGKIYTIGGNTGLTDSNGNGSEYGIKRYTSIHRFCSDGRYTHFYIYKRGTSKPYTNGIGVSVKKTTMYDKYVKDLDTDNELNTASYNILREIMEI